MGGGSYDREVLSSNDASGYSAVAAQELNRSTMAAETHPKGKTVISKSETPIVIAMDVTSSRGDDSKILYDKLPMFFGELIMQEYAEDVEMSFAAIGDATDGDKAPIQICDFAAGTTLDTWLKRLWLEEGGGGSGKESYELTCFYYAFHSKLENAQKAFFFVTGDESFYEKVSKDQVKQWIGDDLESDYPMEKVFEKLKEKYEVFFLFPQKSMDEKKANIDREITQRLAREGAKSGDVVISLMWNNRHDCDLHVWTPSNQEIYYACKKSRCGGELDVDMNAGGATSETPVENVYWPEGGAPLGKYRVEAVNYGWKTGDHSPYEYTVKVKINDKVEFHTGKLSTAGERKLVCTFDYTGKQEKGKEKEKEKISMQRIRMK